MSVQLPDDLRRFVEAELAAGKYASESDLVAEAVRRLRDSWERLGLLTQQLHEEVARMEQGDGITLNSDEELGAFLDSIEAKVDAKIAAARKLAS